MLIMNCDVFPCHGDDVFADDERKCSVSNSQALNKEVDRRKLRPRKSSDCHQSTDLIKKVDIASYF